MLPLAECQSIECVECAMHTTRKEKDGKTYLCTALAETYPPGKKCPFFKPKEEANGQG